MLENWHRIEKIVKWTGLSVNAFARVIGLNRSENLYQIKRGNNGISRELAELICDKYPSVSKVWLLTGEGEMFIEEIRNSIITIPYYKMDAIRYVQSTVVIEPTYNIFFPLFNDCDFAALSFGTAMQPEIAPGAVIMCRKCEIDFIMPGEVYLIISSTFNGIRFIRKDPDHSSLRFVPKNREDYDEINMEPGDITALFIIRGVITNKSL